MAIDRQCAAHLVDLINWGQSTSLCEWSDPQSLRSQIATSWRTPSISMLAPSPWARTAPRSITT
ncbi:MAG: hypothetical protein Q8Q75_05860, partial [Rhodoferax sp.]|nr:hypothetical protein [Rhodoferax sp.]